MKLLHQCNGIVYVYHSMYHSHLEGGGGKVVKHENQKQNKQERKRS